MGSSYTKILSEALGSYKNAIQLIPLELFGALFPEAKDHVYRASYHDEGDMIVDPDTKKELADAKAPGTRLNQAMTKHTAAKDAERKAVEAVQQAEQRLEAAKGALIGKRKELQDTPQDETSLSDRLYKE